MEFKIGDKVVCINEDNKSRLGKAFIISSKRQIDTHSNIRSNDWDWYHVKALDGKSSGGMRIRHMRLLTPLEKLL